ncbi:hypothetical protein VE03_08474 [Pseudogymnoascus sp. 23342-1-I1]|nr:hypothetical protein VE03_08474 [Pseudogymnoascus sp. 23342-1-I1]
MDRHDSSRPYRCDYYAEDFYYEDRYANTFDDGYKHEYPYHKSRLYRHSQQYRTDYYYDDEPYQPAYPLYFRHNYRARDDPYNHWEEELVPTKLHTEEYTTPVGWFYEHLISRAGRRVVTATTVRLWGGLRRMTVLDHRERRARERGM